MDQPGSEPDLPPRVYLAVAAIAVVVIVGVYLFTSLYQIPLPEGR